jgi:membrane protein YqaA with SNARE-associated domain
MAPLTSAVVLDVGLLPLGGSFESVVASATGWPGVGIIFVYSFLIAFILPGPSEIVLVAPLDLGLSPLGNLSGIMLISAVGKAAGSVLAFHLGQEAKQAGPIVRWLRRSRWNVMEWSERQSVQLAQRYGYAGRRRALAPCVRHSSPEVCVWHQCEYAQHRREVRFADEQCFTCARRLQDHQPVTPDVKA